MSFRPVTVVEPKVSTVLVVDSPHSGRIYPADFSYTCPLPMLRQTEDSYVDELVGGAVAAGATFVMAEFPRSYIDVNRAENDIDPAVLAGAWDGVLEPSDRTLLGLGLVRRLCKSNVPVYAAPLPVEDVKRRIETCYRPYHAEVQRAINARMQNFGMGFLVNCHSMPNRGGDSGLPRADFVLGDRRGSSCDVAFTRRVSGMLQELGYSVALNDPYQGMEIVRRYGQPQQGQHALQLEINRQLYMNEQTLEKTDGFVRLQQDLTAFFAEFVADLMCGFEDRLAAE